MAGAPKVTFESLFCVFEFFGVSGSVGALPGHNTTIPGLSQECSSSDAKLPGFKISNTHTHYGASRIRKNMQKIWTKNNRFVCKAFFPHSKLGAPDFFLKSILYIFGNSSPRQTHDGKSSAI